jgi:hypothetical protein
LQDCGGRVWQEAISVIELYTHCSPEEQVCWSTHCKHPGLDEHNCIIVPPESHLTFPCSAAVHVGTQPVGLQQIVPPLMLQVGSALSDTSPVGQAEPDLQVEPSAHSSAPAALVAEQLWLDEPVPMPSQVQLAGVNGVGPVTLDGAAVPEVHKAPAGNPSVKV